MLSHCDPGTCRSCSYGVPRRKTQHFNTPKQTTNNTNNKNNKQTNHTHTQTKNNNTCKTHKHKNQTTPKKQKINTVNQLCTITHKRHSPKKHTQNKIMRSYCEPDVCRMYSYSVPRRNTITYITKVEHPKNNRRQNTTNIKQI